MKYFDRTCADLDRRRGRVLDELHPDLAAKVTSLLAELGGRLTPYCGYRGPDEQQEALASGASAAKFGESPHNFKPSLACDLVLDPRHVTVRAHPQDADYPDLWDDESPDALAAWEALEHAAVSLGLERVSVRGRRDRPHVQLPGWKSLIAT